MHDSNDRIRNRRPCTRELPWNTAWLDYVYIPYCRIRDRIRDVRTTRAVVVNGSKATRSWGMGPRFRLFVAVWGTASCTSCASTVQQVVRIDDDPLANALYKDAAASVEARVKDLMAHMTLQEKAAQLGCACHHRCAGPSIQSVVIH